MYDITNPAGLIRQAVLPFFAILPVIVRDANFKIGVDLSYIFHSSTPRKQWDVLPIPVYVNLPGRDLRNG